MRNPIATAAEERRERQAIDDARREAQRKAAADYVKAANAPPGPGPELPANRAYRERQEAAAAARSPEAVRARQVAAEAARVERQAEYQTWTAFLQRLVDTARDAAGERDRALGEHDLEGALAAEQRRLAAVTLPGHLRQLAARRFPRSILPPVTADRI